MLSRTCFFTGRLLKRSPLVLCLTLLAGVASAQSGTAPGYISSMGDFEVRALDSAYAPSNGKLSMESITPSEWITNDPSTGKLSGVITAWNGGAKGIGSKLFVHGGGHYDSANNGLYVFDFSGSDRPAGWQTDLNISAVSAVRAATATYADGKPTSIHTYDGVVYAHHNNHIYRFNGAHYNPGGGFTSASFKYNVTTKTWTQLPNFPGGGGGAVTIYDPGSGNIFVTNARTSTGYFLRTSNDTWSGAKNVSGLAESAAAWDPTRKRGVALGQGGGVVVNLDFANETVSSSPLNVSGSTGILSQSGLSVVYDPRRDSYWIFGGSQSSGGWGALYEMTASGSSFAMVTRQLNGASIERTSGMVGSYGRFVLMPEWRAIGVVASTTSPAYVIKLPSGVIDLKIPEPPSSVLAR